MRRPRNSFLLGSLAIAATVVLSSCWYSFSGASIPSHLNTVAIPLVADNSTNTLTNLDEELTNLLVDRFVRQTRLSLETVETSSDALLTARIDRYSNQPTSVSGEEQATLNRVTISVFVIYRDQVNNSDVLNRAFSGFEEYDPLDPEAGLSGEAAAASAALEKIADDVFTAATSNW